MPRAARLCSFGIASSKGRERRWGTFSSFLTVQEDLEVLIRWQTLNRKEIFPFKPVILQLEDTLPQAMETNRELIKI